jgi:hypothetical protein
MTRAPTLLLLQGSDDAEGAGTGSIRDKGSTDVFKLLGSLVPKDRLRLTPQFFRRGKRPSLVQYHTVFNLITDADQNPRVLEVAERLLKNFRGKVINAPAAVQRSGREQIAKRLAAIPGLIVPRVLRLRRQPAELAAKAIERSGLNLPLLIREAGTHTGRFTGLAKNMDELPAILAADNQHLATEFVDFRSLDGLYRKYRVWCVGKRLVFRHMIVSEHWNVHASQRDAYMASRPALIEEERALFRTPEGALPESVLQVLHHVRDRMELDMFGVDFGLMPDGRVLLFEANATMNFIKFSQDGPFNYVQQCIRPMQRALWELVDFAPPPGVITSLEAPASLVPSP